MRDPSFAMTYYRIIFRVKPDFCVELIEKAIYLTKHIKSFLMKNIRCSLSWWPGLNRWPLPYQGSALPTELHQHSSERETGLEPATNSLEGCDSTNWVTPAKWQKTHSVGREGFEPPKTLVVRFTVWCIWPLCNLPAPKQFIVQGKMSKYWISICDATEFLVIS